MPGDHFLSGNLNDKVLATSPCDPEDIGHELMDVHHVWAIIWLWRARTCTTCSTAVSFALKSKVDNVEDVRAQKVQDRK